MKSVSTIGVVVLAATLHPLMAATIPVRFSEGVTHGFLVLRSVDGAALAHGELLQVVKGGAMEKRMVFRFKDGSVFDENVTFTQKGVYSLKSYRLSETGPTFAADTEISMTTESGAYRVKTKDHKDGREKVLEGTLDLPADVYNGLILTVVKELPKGAGEVVHFVAFTPQPRIIELALSPVGEEKIAVGDLTKSAVRYVMKPRLGVLLKFFAKIVGRMPADLHAWVYTDDIPAFVGFEGTLGTQGSVWRIETVSPRRPG